MAKKLAAWSTLSVLCALFGHGRAEAATVTGDLKIFVLNVGQADATFTNDLATATSLPNLGLLGASPLLMFAVAILTGLFSNRGFDWLRSVADSTSSSARTTTTTTTTDTTPLPAEDAMRTGE